MTEWPAAEKANLESMLQRGAIAVQFTGCALRLVPACVLPGGYRWHRTTLAEDSIVVRSEAELYGRLPLGAMSLSVELARTGALEVRTLAIGQARVDGVDGGDVPNRAECAEVTHVITAVSVGAFELRSGRTLQGKAEAKTGRFGDHGGNAKRSDDLMRAAGDPDACKGAGEDGPPADCASPLQVFLAPVPGRAPPSPPPGTIQVDVVSADPDTRWDVIIDDQARCTSPCVRDVDPNRPLVLRTRGPRPDQLQVALQGAGAGPLQVSARPLHRGAFVTSLTFTTFGGMGLITGVALAAVGCSQDDHPSLCTAGRVTMLASAPVLAVSIWGLVASQAEAGIRPLFAATQGGGIVGVSGGF